MGRGNGPQVVSCTRQGHDGLLVAKIFDPLYYPFADDDFPHIPNNVIPRAENDFAQESAAYRQLDDKLGGGLIPRFHGSWLVDIPLKDRVRSVGFILMEHVPGFPLDKFDREHLTEEERLRVLALVMEAETDMQFSGVSHSDIMPRNVICSTRDLLASDLRIRIIDFGFVTILKLLDGKVPCEFEALPDSPIKRYWNSMSVDMYTWIPEHWNNKEWNQWLMETWGGSTKYKPPPDNLV